MLEERKTPGELLLQGLSTDFHEYLLYPQSNPTSAGEIAEVKQHGKLKHLLFTLCCNSTLLIFPVAHGGFILTFTDLESESWGPFPRYFVRVGAQSQAHITLNLGT